MGGVDRHAIVAIARQHNADGIGFEEAVDLAGDLANQIVQIQLGEHGVGDIHQHAKIIALMA
ncbi:hypothetical protein D3C80_1818340 [compost metagenome]